MAEKQLIHTVSSPVLGSKFIEYCAEAFPILGSRTAVKKAIGTERLLVNGEKPSFSQKLEPGDALQLTQSGHLKARAFDKKIPVVYQDEYLLVVNKPAGIATNGDRIKTVENAVAGFVEKPDLPDALPRPIAAHRIDLPTKGLLLLAKTKGALIQLTDDFAENRISKEYTALVHGQPKPTGEITQAIKGQTAITQYRTLRTVRSRVFGQLSLVKLKPVTGRTHQLRIHLRQAGHLIVGDQHYAAGQKTIMGKGLFLCATQMAFRHPVTEAPIVLRIDPPSRFEKTLDREEERF